MEIKSEGGFVQDRKPKKEKPDVKLSLVKSQCYDMTEDDESFGLKLLPEDNLSAKTSHSNKWLHKEIHSNLKKENKRNRVIKTDCKVENLELTRSDCNTLSMRISPVVKSFDLNKEPKNNLIGSQKDRKGGKSDDLKYESKNYMETRLEKIPRDILGKYGIIMEDNDWCKSSSVSEERYNVWEEEEEEGNLIIDEEEISIRVNTPKSDLPESKTDLTEVSLSTKENTAGFTNCGHHLVISSVASVEWSIPCDICALLLPNLDSLELHKNGHCLYPGCLDFIENVSEREKHLQMHKSHPAKPFRCQYCRKRFHYYRFVKRHREVCKLLKRSKCPYCNYSSSKVGRFNKHVAKHVNKMTCTDCKKNYIRVKKYMKHMYMHHRKHVFFQCPQCPLRFQLPETIIKHVEIHKLKVLECGLSEFIQVQPVDDS